MLSGRIPLRKKPSHYRAAVKESIAQGEGNKEWDVLGLFYNSPSLSLALFLSLSDKGVGLFFITFCFLSFPQFFFVIATRSRRRRPTSEPLLPTNGAPTLSWFFFIRCASSRRALLLLLRIIYSSFLFIF